MRARFFAPIVLAVLALLPTVAAAQSSGDVATADALFEQGRKLLAEGKLADACPKLEESLRIDATGPTLFLLAECLEKSGRTASASARWKEAQELAKKRGKADKEHDAAAHVRALEPKVPKMRIEVAPATASLNGLEVRRAGAPVGPGAWGADLPQDPGEITVEATAPGKKPWRTKVNVVVGQSVKVQVPALEDDAKAAATPTEPPTTKPAPVASNEQAVSAPIATEDPGRTQRFVGYGIGAVGLVGMAVGGIFLIQASSTQTDIQNADKAGKCVNGGCDSLVSNRDGKATVAYIGLIGGGAALVGGLVVVLTAPSGGGGLAAGFAPTAGGGALRLGGAF